MPLTRLRYRSTLAALGAGLLLLAACDSGTPSPTVVAPTAATLTVSVAAPTSTAAVPLVTDTVVATVVPTEAVVVPTSTNVATATAAPTETVVPSETAAPILTVSASTATAPNPTRTATRLPPIRKTATATAPPVTAIPGLMGSATPEDVASPTVATGTVTPGGDTPYPCRHAYGVVRLAHAGPHAA